MLISHRVFDCSDATELDPDDIRFSVVRRA